MTIFKLHISGEDETILGSEELQKGKHALQQGTESLVVTVGNRDSVTLHLDTFQGKPDALMIPGIDDTAQLLSEEGRSDRIRVNPKVGEAAVALTGGELGYLTLTRLDVKPVIGERIRV